MLGAGREPRRRGCIAERTETGGRDGPGRHGAGGVAGDLRRSARRCSRRRSCAAPCRRRSQKSRARSEEPADRRRPGSTRRRSWRTASATCCARGHRLHLRGGRRATWGAVGGRHAGGKALEQAGTLKSGKRGRQTIYYHQPTRCGRSTTCTARSRRPSSWSWSRSARAGRRGSSARRLSIFTARRSSAAGWPTTRCTSVRFSAKVKEGWILRQGGREARQPLLQRRDGELLSYTGRLRVHAAVPSNPVEVVDLDNLATFENARPGELEMLDAEMKALVGREGGRDSALRNSSCRCLASPVFFPVWRFHVRDKQGTAEARAEPRRAQGAAAGAGQGTRRVGGDGQTATR